jgi:hypothetical protein
MRHGNQHRLTGFARGLRAAAVSAFFALASVAHAASTQDAVITVTPVADVSISLSAGSYAFGAVDVNTSTNSATPITLTNTGEVSVTVEKQIASQSNPAGWVADTAVGRDHYVLYAATAAARLGLSGFTAATRFGAEGVNTSLTGTTGAQPLLPPTGAGQSVDLWFRLDMPNSLSSLQSRSITVRFTATAQ